MFKTNLGFAEEFTRWFIPIVALIAVGAKLYNRKKTGLIISLIFDIILVVYLYNPTDCSSIQGFCVQFSEIEVHFVVFFFMYLIFYYRICFLRLGERVL